MHSTKANPIPTIWWKIQDQHFKQKKLSQHWHSFLNDVYQTNLSNPTPRKRSKPIHCEDQTSKGAPRTTSNKRQRRFSHAKCSLWISSTRRISSSDKMPVTSWIKVSAETLGLRSQHPTWCTSQMLEDYNPIPSSLRYIWYLITYVWFIF